MSGSAGKNSEKRFRRGAWLLLALALMSAVSTTALYWGIRIPVFYATSLALPVVTDIALETFFSGWIWMEKVRYYWFVGSSVFAGVLALVAILSLTTSFSGHAFTKSFAGKGIGKLFSGLGLAQMLSARALSAFGLLFYTVDLALSAGLVFAFPQTFTPLYLFLLANLLIHLSSLSFLGYSFTAGVGGGREALHAPTSDHGEELD